MKLWLIYKTFYYSITKQGFFKLSDAKDQGTPFQKIFKKFF